MAYRLPLRVNEKKNGEIELIDADGLVIASAPTYPWHGVPREHQPEFVRENYRRLAAAANAAP
jgi:hypothetical protein